MIDLYHFFLTRTLDSLAFANMTDKVKADRLPMYTEASPFPKVTVPISLPSDQFGDYFIKHFAGLVSQHALTLKNDKASSIGESELTMESLANLKMEQVSGFTDSQTLQIARFLIKSTQKPEAYLPDLAPRNTTFAEELAIAEEQKELRSQNKRCMDQNEDVSDDDLIPLWRHTFTPAQNYLLLRAFMDCSHPVGSKAFFDGKRRSQIDPEQGAAHDRWQAWEGRDKRIDSLPAMCMKLRIIQCNELSDAEELTLNAFISDTLQQVRIYGNAFSMYCWELVSFDFHSG